MNTVRQGDVDYQRLGEWGVFERVGGVERGVVNAVDAVAALTEAANMKKGKMGVGWRACEELMGRAFIGMEPQVNS